MEFRAVVLAGGTSRRMGRDKAFIELGGLPLVSRCCDAVVEAGAREVIVVGGDRPRLEALGLAVVDDSYPGRGPVGGVVTALEAGQGPDLVVVLACDLAAPSPTAVDLTVEALVAHPEAGVARPSYQQMPQWLHGCWRVSTALEPLRDAFDRGARSFREATAGLVVVGVEGVAPSHLADLDTVHDLEQARARQLP
ncbi:MAG: molybdenum cofactor guanylyltransferase [Acidimicrobiales bacterium]